MIRPKLTNWFELRWPRNVSDDQIVAALASLSGLPHGARLLFEVAADERGITHKLAATEVVSETVAAALRAAVPSLRLTRIDPADNFEPPRLRWRPDPLRG